MIAAEKAILRRQAAATRAQLAATDAGGELTHRVIRRLQNVLSPKPGDIVSAFMPIRSEINLTPLLRRLADDGCVIALPRVVAPGQPLAFHRWRAEESLQAGALGVPTPAADSETLRPDIVIAPMLAFDRRGYRLGYGGGFYDRTLAALRADGGGVIAAGAAWAGQEVPCLPIDGHDQPLDIIVTEKEVIRP